MRYGSSATNFSIRTRGPPWTRSRNGPSGILGIPATLVRSRDRHLDAQDAVLVGGASFLRDDVGAERDLAPERAALDLDLLVDATFRVACSALSADHQCATADLDRQVSCIDPGEV